MAKNQQAEQENPWEELFRDVQESLERGESLPDPARYTHMTKAVGTIWGFRRPRPRHRPTFSG